MKIGLKTELEKYVEDQVRSGRFGSADDVLAAALTRMMQDERLDDFAPGELDRLMAVGEASLDRGDVVTPDEAREHFRRRAMET